MSFAIHSSDGRGFGAGMADYPPPFKHPIPNYVKAIRDALWAIEGGLGGQVEWQATFGQRQNEIALMCASVHGSQFGYRKKKASVSDNKVDRPSLYDKNADPEIWANTAINGERLTWRELAEKHGHDLGEANAILSVISDLDRCPHGRHETDICFGCQAEGHDYNQGNPYLTVGQRLGTTLGGRVIVWPGYPAYRTAEGWVAS